MKIPYIKIPITDVAAYIAPFSAAEKGLIFQAVLNFGLYQKWDDLELSQAALVGYSNVQEIVENEIKSYKKFCKEQKQKIKKFWQQNQKHDDTNVLPERNNQTKTETEYINNKETIQESKPQTKLTANEIAFEQFWQAFPKQRAGAKDKARSAFTAALKRHKDMTGAQIADKVREYARSDEVARGFAKGAAAWLNDDRFLQDYKPATGSGTNLEQARAAGEREIRNIFGGK